MYDVFLCHASEDKASVVVPLTKALQTSGIDCWLDQGEIRWGESISGKVNGGLAESRFAIVVLSMASLQKNWQQREINAVINLEASSGEVRVLPLLVGDTQEIQTILTRYPLLNDKLYLQWQGDPTPIVQAFQQHLVERSPSETMQTMTSESPVKQRTIPIPKLKRRITDLEKDRFLKQAFAVIKDYFAEGLKQLEQHHAEIETDLTEIHNLKFVSKAYVNGDLKAQRKIWQGGIGGSRAISYYDNVNSYDNDNSCNGWVSIEDDGSDLYLTGTTLNFYGDNPERLPPEQAAELLWQGFAEQIER